MKNNKDLKNISIHIVHPPLSPIGALLSNGISKRGGLRTWQVPWRGCFEN